jgi:hypothetical protein
MEVPSRNSPGVTEENHKKSHSGPPKYESTVLPLCQPVRCSPAYSVYSIINKYIYIYISESMFVAMFVGIFVGMYTINSLTPSPIPTKFGVFTNQNPTKKVGLQKNFDFYVYRCVSLNNSFSYASPVARQRWCFLWGQLNQDLLTDWSSVVT